MKIITPVFLFCCLGVLWGLPTAASAKIKLTPKMTVEEKYTDNLFLDDQNEQDEWITTLSPGIDIMIDSRWIDLSLDYSFRYDYYKNNNDLTNFDFSGGQRANLGTTFFEGRPFTLLVDATISRETLDERKASSATNELINKSTVYDLTVNPQYRFRLGGQSSLVFGYIYDRTYHDDSRGDDSQGHSARVSLLKELSINTQISANYTYKMNLSDDEEDYNEQSYTLGLSQQLGPRTKISLEGGFSTVEYVDINDDQESFTWSADVDYRLSAPITLSLMFSQDFDNSATDGLTKSRDASFLISYKKDSFAAGLEAFWEQTDYIRTVREDESYGGRFDLSISLNSNLSSGLDAEYEVSDFAGQIDNSVDQYSAGASLHYDIGRFLTSIHYEYRVYDADINTQDYTENTVTLSVSVRF